MRHWGPKIFQGWGPSLRPDTGGGSADIEPASNDANLVTADAADERPEATEPPAEGRPLILFMPKLVHDQIIDRLADMPPEEGGFGIGPKGSENLLTHFLYDPGAMRTAATFKPDAARFNDWLARLNAHFREVDDAGCDFRCVIHSHPSGFTAPSAGDVEFARATFARAKNAGATILYMPIVCDGRLYPYAVTQPDLTVRPVTLTLI
jgi:hypothetical protein